MSLAPTDPNTPPTSFPDPFLYGILPYIYTMETPDSFSPDTALNDEWGSELPLNAATASDVTKTGNPQGAKKDERFELRLSPADKQLLARAQEIAGDKTLSGFASRILREQARKVVAEHTVIHLSEADFLHFCEVLANPPEPNAHLLAMGKVYQDYFKDRGR
jgi:uncharacterized protein (DUF1778 family)